jgi:CBS domain-containing protein
VGPCDVRATAVPGQKLAGAAVTAASDETLGPASDELYLRDDLDETGLLGEADPGFGVAAEAAVGAAGEAEPGEKGDIELRSGFRHRPERRERAFTVLISRACAQPMVLLAKDIMEKVVLTVDEGADALTCARTMAAQHKGYAVLTRPAGTIAGIVTEWDYLSKVVAPGLDPARVPVREIATAVVDSCAPDTPTDVVVTTMAEKGVRRMVVRTGDQVLGIITARTVLRMFREYVDKVSSEIAGFESNATPLG